jgi:Tol biopolymer transport system component
VTFEPGKTLSHYRLLEKIGEGGMGMVYKAHDERLGRDVALKVLPAGAVAGDEARRRFRQEALALSRSSHPHIATIYDFDTENSAQGPIDFLVMEHLEGETLADRLARGPLPIEQAVRTAIEIAGALDRAHQQGVIHRDLKPGNIMLTKSGAKVLDFGLAKLRGATIPAATSTHSALPTVGQGPLTAEGAILGTLHYMAPEQLEGGEADARSDLFALGGILFEMITGKRAFDGKSPATVIAAILEREPPALTALQPAVSPALDHVVKRCMTKNPEERWQAAGDVALELKWIAESGARAQPAAGPAAVAARRGPWDRAGWAAAAVLALVAIAAAWLGRGAWSGRSAGQGSRARALYFSNAVPSPANDLALSPDGRMLAMVAYSNQSNRYVIWTQEIGSRTATALAGTEDASHPFWSPDGRSIGFFAQGKLKKVDVAGGSAQVLCEAPYGRGGAWNQEGTILFSPDAFLGIYRVSSSGGKPTEVTKPDPSRYESSHRWPVFLPDGRHFLYLAANFAGQFEKNTIVLGSLDSSETRPIVGASSNPAYAEPGYLLYMQENSLVATRFDPKTFVLSGDPRTLADGIEYFPQIDLGLFSVAGDGTLTLQTGRGVASSQLTWFDRNGRAVGAIGSPGQFSNPSLSPDGRRVAVDKSAEDGRRINIWVQDLANNALSRLTFNPWLEQTPVWSPDGRQVAFSSNQKLHFSLHIKNADGSGSEEQVADLNVAQEGFWDWSRDAKTMLLRNGSELWLMSASDHQVKPWMQERWTIRNAQFSPDGKWVAYSSNETGAFEVYVSPFPSANGKRQVSSRGGEEPRWRHDGRELYYLSGERELMAVEIRTDPTFEARTPVTLFQTHLRQPISALDVFSYDVSGDGQRFLVNTKVDEPGAAPVSVILNWTAALQK